MSNAAHQLAQAVLTGSLAAVLEGSDLTSQDYIVTKIIAAEVGGSNATVRLCHDADGTSWLAGTALFWDAPVSANTTAVLFEAPTPEGGFKVGRAGSIAAQSGGGGAAVTLTIYGYTSNVGRGAP